MATAWPLRERRRCCSEALGLPVFLWDAVADRSAAWSSGRFLALASTSIELSQFARFYALHALTFWYGAIGMYALTAGRPGGRPARRRFPLGTILSLRVAFRGGIRTPRPPVERTDSRSSPPIQINRGPANPSGAPRGASRTP